MAKTFELNDITAYKISRNLSKEVWNNVEHWNYLAKKTVGDQLIRSTDSISANISEGFGRYHKKDKVKFYYNARASVFETKHWVEIALERRLIGQKTKDVWVEVLDKLPREINIIIKLTMTNLKL